MHPLGICILVHAPEVVCFFRGLLICCHLIKLSLVENLGLVYILGLTWNTIFVCQFDELSNLT